MQLTPAQLTHLLDVWPVARLATMTPAGSPRILPIVFVALDGVLYSPVDGKPKRSTQLRRLDHVAMRPSVSLLLDHYDADWNALWWVSLDAEADVLTGDALPEAARDRIAGGLRGKYAQYAGVLPFAGEPTVIRLRVLTHRAWSASALVWECIEPGRADRARD